MKRKIISSIASQAAWYRMENGPNWETKNWPKNRQRPTPEMGKNGPKIEKIDVGPFSILYQAA